MRLKLYHKIILVLAVALALVLSVIYTYLDNNLKEYTYNRIRSGLDRETALLGTMIESRGPEMTMPAMDTFADEAGAALGTRVTVIGPDGRVLGDSEISLEELPNIENHRGRPEVQQAFATGSGSSR